MQVVVLHEVSTNRTLYINVDAITHFFVTSDLESGTPATIIHLANSILYLVKEPPDQIMRFSKK